MLAKTLIFSSEKHKDGRTLLDSSYIFIFLNSNSFNSRVSASFSFTYIMGPCTIPLSLRIHRQRVEKWKFHSETTFIARTNFPKLYLPSGTESNLSKKGFVGLECAYTARLSGLWRSSEEVQFLRVTLFLSSSCLRRMRVIRINFPFRSTGFRFRELYAENLCRIYACAVHSSVYDGVYTKLKKAKFIFHIYAYACFIWSWERMGGRRW